MKKCLNKIIKYVTIYVDKENNTKKIMGGNKMGEIKRVDGQVLRRELEEMGRLTVYYDLLQDKLDSLNDIIYSHHNKTREEINLLMLETNEIEKVLAELWEKLNILQLFKDIENGEQEENQDFALEKNGNFTTLNLIITFKKYLHKKGVDTLGGRGEYKKMEVLEKFVIETKKLPQNFEVMKQTEQKNFIIENGIFQQ